MTGYCLDTDIISAVLRPAPALGLVRRLAATPPDQQFTTSIAVRELVYGAARRGSQRLSARIEEVIASGAVALPFDEGAARAYGGLRAALEQRGESLAEPDLRIASIALVNELTLVSGNLRHFGRVPGLTVENWLDEP